VPARTLSLKTLRDECDTLSMSLLARQPTSQAAIDEQRPGSPANQDRGPRGWLRFFGILHRLHAESVAKSEPTATPSRNLSIEQALDRAAAQAPESVRLAMPDTATGERKIVQCYPKSLRALRCLDAWEHQLRYTCEAYKALKVLNTASDIALLEPAGDVIDRRYQLLVWAVTTPGPWLPFDPREENPTLPDWLSLIGGVDVLAILIGHRRANHEPIALFSRLIAELEEREDSGLGGWGGFVAQSAYEQGVSPEVLDRDTDLRFILGQVLVRARAVKAMEARTKAVA
jgi:hypothetical protein